MIHTGKLFRAELLNDNVWPYTNVKAVWEAHKDRYPGKTLIVTNGHWCEGVKPCPMYKIDGVWLAENAPWNCLGLTWSGNEKPVWMWSNSAVKDNFICTIPAIVGGARQSVDNQTAGVKRLCNRTWWGWDKSGNCTVEVTTTGYTLEGIIDRMEALGIVDGIVLDGSGSSQWADAETWYKGSDGRTVYEFLLLWFEGGAAPVETGNSPLVDYVKLSPHKRTREKPISKITIHHMACVATVEQCGAGFSGSRVASSNYGIDSAGRVGLYVNEADRAITSSSTDNDNVAVTIEVSNSAKGGRWPVSDKAYAKLIDLCVDICKRNGIKALNFTDDATGNLTYHSMFAATACPGPYLKERFPAIAEAVNARLVPAAPVAPPAVVKPPEANITPPAKKTVYRVMEVTSAKQLASFSAEVYAERYRARMMEAGKNVFVEKAEI